MYKAHADSRTYQRGSKKVVAIVAISLLLVIGSAAYTLLSLSAWKGYETRLSRERDNYGILKQQALDTTASATSRLTALRTLDDKVKMRSSLCHINPAVAWQSNIVPVIGDGVHRCQLARSSLDSIAEPLSTLRQYLDVAVPLQAASKKLAAPVTVLAKDWTTSGLDRAKDLQKQIQVIPASGDGIALKKQAEAIADGLVTNWQSLLLNSSEASIAGSVSSLSSLTKSYANLMNLAKTNETTVQAKTDRLSKAAISIGF